MYREITDREEDYNHPKHFCCFFPEKKVSIPFRKAENAANIRKAETAASRTCSTIFFLSRFTPPLSGFPRSACLIFASFLQLLLLSTIPIHNITYSCHYFNSAVYQNIPRTVRKQGKTCSNASSQVVAEVCHDSVP